MAFGNPIENTGGPNEPTALPVPVAEGGTGSATAAAARDALDVEPGVDVQGYDADLANLAAVTPGTQTVVGRAGGSVAALAIDADLASTSGSDDTLPSAKAVKNVTALPSLGTINTAITGVLRADAGVIVADTDVTDIVAAASESAAGKVELATAAEVTTGTDAGRAICPDQLAASDFGKRIVGIQVVDSATATATGDGKAFFRIPAALGGYNLVAVAATVYTAGTTGTTDVQIRNVTAGVDMLSTKLTIDSAETDSSTAAAAAVINTSNDDVQTGEKIAIDVDAVSTTPAQGLYVEMTFQLP